MPITLKPMRFAAGFTLLELMVVVLIMGLSLGLVALAVGRDSGSMAREEAEEFMRRADFVAEQAVINGDTFGLFVQPQNQVSSTEVQWCFHWQRFRSSGWEALPDTLEQRCLAPTLAVDMVVENEPYEYDPEQETPTPVAVFYPSGESTPFELAIYEHNQGFNGDPDAVQRIEIDMMGALVWQNRAAEIAADGAGLR